MLDSVLDSIVTALKAESINAFREFPDKRADVKTGVSVSVGIDSCKYLSSGMGEYLGIRADVRAEELKPSCMADEWSLHFSLRYIRPSAYRPTARLPACSVQIS